MKKDRITREKDMLPEMIKIYCHGVHKTKKGKLCEECKALCDYSLNRLDHCRWGNEKNFCSQCPCHCYKPEMREKIRAVMRYAGPRILFTHPLAGTLHAFETLKQKLKKDSSSPKND
ncbi:MAG: nitrous oxide-stimulated promoter family protein [Clostridia bacterium]|nr:nitrous oxide-stimulated promoter family protein [Clostridia bacterium]